MYTRKPVLEKPLHGFWPISFPSVHTGKQAAVAHKVVFLGPNMPWWPEPGGFLTHFFFPPIYMRVNYRRHLFAYSQDVRLWRRPHGGICKRRPFQRGCDLMCDEAWLPIRVITNTWGSRRAAGISPFRVFHTLLCCHKEGCCDWCSC